MAPGTLTSRKTQTDTKQAGNAETLRFTDACYRRLRKQFGDVRCPLTYEKPHQLVIAVILSAQCTDERVNLTTPALFAAYPEPEDLARAPLAKIEKLIYSTSFYRNKAKNIQGFSRMLVEDFQGEVPRDVQILEKMPGVGRKTANVVVQELYDIPSGMVVDTHVSRISRVLGLTRHKDPGKIEKDLILAVRKKYWIDWSLYMIFLGRYSCAARKRECGICPLRDICPAADS